MPTRGLVSRGKTGFAAPAPPPTHAPWGSHSILGALESVGDVGRPCWFLRMFRDYFTKRGARRVGCRETRGDRRETQHAPDRRVTRVATTGDNGVLLRQLLLLMTPV